MVFGSTSVPVKAKENRKSFIIDMLKFFKQHTWQALAVTFGGASTWKAGLSAAPTYNTKHCLVHYTNRNKSLGGFS